MTVNSRWPHKTVAEVANILDSLRRPLNAQERSGREGTVPYFGAAGQVGWIDKPLFDEPLVLLGEDAIDFSAANTSKAYLVEGPSWINNHAHVLRATSEVLPAFLAASLNVVDYAPFASFGTRSKLTKGALERISVPVPSLVEQTRVVDLLAAADSMVSALQAELIGHQNAAHALHAHLLAQVTTSALLKDVLLPDSLTVAADPSTQNLAGMRNGFRGLFTRSTHGTWKTAYKQMQVLRESQIVVGKLRAQDGGVARVTKEFAGSVLSSEFLVFTVNEAVAIPEYVELAFRSRELISSIQMASQGTGAGKERVNTFKLLAMSAPIPPLETQREIVEVLTCAYASTANVKRRLEQAESLRQQLLHDLMSGSHVIPESYDSLLESTQS